MDSVDTQFKQLSWGVETILTAEHFKSKLLKSQKENRPLRVKLGVDPTAPDIHLGHTVALRKLRQFQDLGHQAILLMGGFTAQIGDPSGKSKTRPPLDLKSIEANTKTYLEQVQKVLHPDRLTVVDNRDWLDAMPLREALKLLSQSTLSKILEHNTFSDRMSGASSIRMHELIYPFLQGYDSIHLQADVELGGTDQLFNIAFGRELQKDYGQEPQCALLVPILTGTDGVQKMSKSLGNYIGVMESPKVMTQKILNMRDENILPYFKLLTLETPETVQGIEQELKNNPTTETVLKWKHRLAENLVTLYHAGSPSDETALFLVPASELENGTLPLLKALLLTGFAKSNREAMQHLQSGAVRVDGKVQLDRHFQIHFGPDPILLNLGKKKFVKLSMLTPENT
jgi:tyrosyl-tRNA synthetase